MTMRDGRVDVSDSGCGVINAVTIDTDRHAGVLTTVSRAKPYTPSESAMAAFDGVSLSKVLLRYS